MGRLKISTFEGDVMYNTHVDSIIVDKDEHGHEQESVSTHFERPTPFQNPEYADELKNMGLWQDDEKETK